MKNDEVNLKGNSLVLIPKIEKYIEYILNILLKLPRIEKFSIGNEYKSSMYKMIEEAIYLNKISLKKGNVKEIKNKENECRERLNNIDVLLNCQRIYLRIMDKNHWIDNKKFNIAMEYIYEIGKILGGLMKYYGKNDTK